MAISKAMRAALKALSYMEPEVGRSYKLHRKLQEIPAIFAGTPPATVNDIAVDHGDYAVPLRVFYPPGKKQRTMLYFHGGGWVIGNIDSYEYVCANMAAHIGCTVVSVDYRLAPEHKFPVGLEDCYAVAREVYLHGLPGIDCRDTILAGDSAGGNLAAAVSLLAQERGEFLPTAQILLYPATFNNHSASSPFPSVRENGEDYLLTSKRIREYMELYTRTPEDYLSKYFAPMLADDLTGQPRTLIITAEYDPLRDEGEAYGEKLRKFGVETEVHRLEDALHGFIQLPYRFEHVRMAIALMRKFIFGEPDGAK